MQKPRVSVIVPCYGVEKYLDRCLDSLVNQTLKDIEIILVDDKSPDNVPKICDDWANKDSRIKVVHKEKNEGLGFARNTGLDFADGEYVAFVDSDDYIGINTFFDAYESAKNNDSDFVFYGYNVEVNPGKWKVCNENELVFDANAKIKDYLMDMIACAPGVKNERLHNMAVWHGLYKKSVIDENNIRFSSERVYTCEDIPFQTDFLLKSKRCSFLHNPYYYYCLNNVSLSSTFKIEKFDRFVKLHALLLEKTDSDSLFIQRVDRFFIGFVRSYCLNLFKSKIDDKKSVVTNVVNHPIWDLIKQRYNPSWLPLYQNIYMRLILKKKVTLLKYFSMFILLLKNDR